MYSSTDKTNINKTKEQLKTNADKLEKMNTWLAKMGRMLNTPQQSNYK